MKMNTLRLSLVVAAALWIAMASAAQIRFPLAMWSKQAFDDVTESHKPQHMQQVVESLQTAAEASGAANLVVIVKEAFTSRHFVQNAKYYEFIRTQVKSNAQLYTNLQEPFNVTTFRAAHHNALSYTLQSTSELNDLVNQIAADLKSSNLTQNVILVLVKESVDVKEVDTVVEQVQTVAVAANENTLMALTGNEGTSGTALLDFQQTDSTMLQDGNLTDVGGITLFLTPTILSGLLIALFIIAVLIYCMLQLLYVQTPEVFVNTSIDFGRIEK